MSLDDLTTPISIRMPIKIVLQLRKEAHMKGFVDPKIPKLYDNVTQAIITKIKVADQVSRFKTQLNNPEFLKSIKQLRKGDDLIKFVATMDNEMKEALKFILQNDLDYNFKVKPLV